MFRDFWLEIYSVAQIDLITATWAVGEREKSNTQGNGSVKD
jgi:hypothetical protein